MAGELLGSKVHLYREVTAGGGIFAKVANITRITPPPATRAKAEVTDLDDATRRYLAGLADLGDIALTVHYIPGNTLQEAIRAEVQAGLVADGRDVAIWFNQGPNLHIIYEGFWIGFAPGEDVPGEPSTAVLTFAINRIVSGPSAGEPPLV